MVPRCIAWLLLLVALGTPAAGAAPEVRGMTISCQTDGREWVGPAFDDTLAELESLGVNWITIHPYGWIRADGTVVPTTPRDLSEGWLAAPIEAAHRRGLRIMIKPHLGYGGSPFTWRGAIRFERDEDVHRFFRTYREWISQLAGAAAAADAFVVGTELGGTLEHIDEWREIIAATRSRTRAPLTYAANWDNFERVPFWKDLDAIGVQAYFPLVAHEDVPTPAELGAAWQALANRLEAYAAKVGHKVVLTELGYDRSVRAALRPWEGGAGRRRAELVQRRCLEAALAALEGRESIVGVFLWKWFVGASAPRENFRLANPSLKRLISEHWAENR